jgi:hypothetical protein
MTERRPKVSETKLSEEKREDLGRLVRDVWLYWLSDNPSASGKRPASWSAKWDDLKEEDKEVDRMIGTTVYLKAAETQQAKMKALREKVMALKHDGIVRDAFSDSERQRTLDQVLKIIDTATKEAEA